MYVRIAASFALALTLLAAPAMAKELKFVSMLSGEREPTLTGSKATGQAVIYVDTDKQTVDVKLYINGLTIDQLSNGLRGTPMGPIHLHLYGGHDHSHNADASLVFPVPYGPSYTSGQDSFQVETGGVEYAKGAGLVNTKATFEEFLHSMESGRVVLNVHTNRFGDGEISGDVTPG